MDFVKLKNLVKVNTHISRWNRGVIIYNRRLVDHVNFNIDGNTITLEGMVESEYDNEVYRNSITIDAHDHRILNGKCNCDDFRSRSDENRFFICKHIVATSISGLNMAARDMPKASEIKTENSISNINLSPSKKLLNLFNDKTKEKVNLEVNINIDSYNITSDFKIGTDKMYVLKNIKAFANAKLNDSILEYGKNFIYNPSIHYFDEKDEALVSMLEFYGTSVSPYANSSVNTKLMDLGASGLRNFLDTLRDKEFTLNYYDEKYKPQVIRDSLPIKLNIDKKNDKIVLSTNEDLPTPLTSKGDVLLYNDNVYILSGENALPYKNMYSLMKENKEIPFEKEELKNILGSLVPKLEEFTNEISLDEEIKNNIVSDFKTEFYFDLSGNQIACELKFIYNDQNGEKYILPDTKKEKIYKKELVDNHFIKENSSYIFKGNDEDLFNFLNTKLEKLKEIGDVFYSDKFKGRKIYKSSAISASISQGENDYLDFSFNISDIDKKEYRDILLAFREKRNFYKLKDGSFIDLQEVKTKNFLELIDNLDIVHNEDTKINNNKLFYINEMLEYKDLDFITGADYINSVCEKFKDLDKINKEVPKELHGNLRDYQITGFNWFNTLDHYKFGGILADEMGLGKTLQTITFLLSQKNKKSLIVTPTSLIYNWKSEFENFAPSMKVLLIHGNKAEREKCLDSMNQYDVIITTYGTLRNDLDLYENRSFDFCIIDEAQYIKNPFALTTQSVKDINAKVKFALTGTPIENNLIELWSIFDFVMPGYLYNRNKFQDLFIGREDNISNLKRLIKPFILRRTKKDVMTELPDKIEKKFYIELNDDQRKLYTAYVEEVKDKLNNPELKNDKITILSYLTKLRQLCLDPSVLVENYDKKSSKIEACLELVEESIESNHKVLLFSQFTSVLKNIGYHLDKNNISYSYLDGQTRSQDRISLVNEFNNSDDNKVFLISLKAGGTGLNLTSADVVIHFDPWWNPSVENQASDRAHRFGQKNVVHVIKLISKGTIEEKIIKLQENKKELIDEFINGDLANGNILKSLSDREIIDLFS